MRTSKRYSLQEYIQGIKSRDIKMLSKAFSLLESDLKNDQELGNSLVKALLPYTGNSTRIAITGSPGVGKSTFIETLGTALTDLGLRVAVLSIDPSSVTTKGSILGDKTRMEKLSKNNNAFIRPSASKALLGGTTTGTRESILLCEAAQYDVIFIETVGVGQSEITAAQLSDVFLVLLEPGAGDDIQAIKKGIIEVADIIAVTKADIDPTKAMLSLTTYLNELHDKDFSKDLAISATKKEDVLKVWHSIELFVDNLRIEGLFDKKRAQQRIFWLHESLKKNILNDLYTNKAIAALIAELEKEINEGTITAQEASLRIIERYKSL